MMQAIWNETVLAESDQTILVEGNHYFPPDSIRKAFFKMLSMLPKPGFGIGILTETGF